MRALRTLLKPYRSFLSSLLPTLRLRSVQRVLAFGFLLACLIVIAAYAAGRQYRESALSDSERDHQNIAFLLSEHFGRQLEGLSGALDEIVKTLLAGALRVDDLTVPFRGLELADLLERHVAGHPQIARLALFDVHARVVAVHSKPAFLSDLPLGAEVVEEFAANPHSEDRLRTLRHPVSGAWLLVLAKPIRGGDGNLLGAVVGAIDLSVWQKLPTALSLRHPERIALVHTDGTLVLRHPEAGAPIGQKLAMPQARVPLTDANPQRTFRVRSPVDGDDRIGAARKIKGFPLLVSANTTARDAISDYARHMRVLAAAAVAGLAIVAIILFLVVREVLSEAARSERRLEQERKKLDLALNNMTQGLLLYDPSHRLQICNRSYIEMFNLSPDVIKPGCSFRDVVRHRQQTGSFNGDFEAYCSAIERDIAVDRVERRLVMAPNGRVVQMSNKRLPGGSWIATMEDVTELQRSHERIAHMAMHDALTSLSNRRHFREQLAQRLPDLVGDASLALLLVDLDNFKIVNDTYGHGVGDALLSGFAQRLLSCTGEDALVARLGGDEFAIVLPQAGVADATGVAAAILQSLQAPIEAGRHTLETNASIGIVIARPGDTDPDQLIKRADLAMYAAKSSERGSYRTFEPEMEAAATARHKLEIDLRHALAERQLEVHYQPIVNLRSGAIVGREALVRWRHPERGMISPAEFIPIAEETHLIVNLGKFVLDEACRQAAGWAPDTYVAVNVSPIQFRNETFALDTIAALNASGLDPSRLVLEVTETVLLQREAVVLETMRRLRAIGVQIALDDFGTGYSSLSYLQRFPFNKIKIDRSFVTALLTTGDSRQIVAAILSIARAVGTTVTAEGVETEEQKRILTELGCDEAQGFLFGKPVAAETAKSRQAA